jgi:hypothetical protein
LTVLRPAQTEPRLAEGLLAQTVAVLNDEWQRERFGAMVLDLRGNTGGLLFVAVGLGAIFLPADTTVLKLVSVKGRERQAHRRAQDYRGERSDPLRMLPPPARIEPRLRARAIWPWPRPPSRRCAAPRRGRPAPARASRA